MTPGVNGNTQLFLANLDRIQERIANANEQISSGLKVTVASDAPDEVEPILQLRAQQAQNQQEETNLGLAQTQASSADTALSAAISLVNSAISIATQGASTMLDASSRQSLAANVQALQSEMVSYSQTQVQGVYIFSGDQSSSASYQLNPLAPTGVTQVTAAAATQQIQNPAGAAFSASLTAQQIFDTRNGDGSVAADNVFAALNNLQTALTNNDPTGVTNCIDSLQQASTRLNSSEAFYGNVEQRIQQAQNYAATEDTQLQTQLSQNQDADVAAEATELTQANTQLQAAFETQAQMPTKSLFDYLA